MLQRVVTTLIVINAWINFTKAEKIEPDSVNDYDYQVSDDSKEEGPKEGIPAAELVAPKNGPLFGCNDYAECSNLEDSAFNKMMIFTGVKLAKLAYNVKEDKNHERYQNPDDKKFKRYNKQGVQPHHVFDKKEYISDFLFNDTVYDLFDDPKEAKDWMEIKLTKGFFLRHPKGKIAQVLGFSGVMGIKVGGEDGQEANEGSDDEKLALTSPKTGPSKKIVVIEPEDEDDKDVNDGKSSWFSGPSWFSDEPPTSLSDGPDPSIKKGRRRAIFIVFRGTVTKSDAKDDTDMGPDP